MFIVFFVVAVRIWGPLMFIVLSRACDVGTYFFLKTGLFEQGKRDGKKSAHLFVDFVRHV
jgi:hypothetical protein